MVQGFKVAHAKMTVNLNYKMAGKYIFIKLREKEVPCLARKHEQCICDDSG